MILKWYTDIIFMQNTFERKKNRTSILTAITFCIEMRIMMGTYYQRQNNEIKKEESATSSPNSFVKAAQIFGAIALASVLTFTIYPPFIFASLAIILALLSTGKEKMHTMAKQGILLSGISLVINILIIITTMTVILGDGPLHNQFNETFEQVYGQSFDDILEDIENGEFDEKEFYQKALENTKNY